MTTLYKYRGTEYPTRYEAMSAARDEARARNRPVSEEAAKIATIKREANTRDRFVI